MSFIWAVHESLPDAEPIQVDAEAFRLVWQLRGFHECDPPVDVSLEVEPAPKSRRTTSTAPAAPSGDEKE